MGFISIRVAVFYADSPNLMHPAPGTGNVETTQESLPVNIDGVDGYHQYRICFYILYQIWFQIRIALDTNKNTDCSG